MRTTAVPPQLDGQFDLLVLLLLRKRGKPSNVAGIVAMSAKLRQLVFIVKRSSIEARTVQAVPALPNQLVHNAMTSRSSTGRFRLA
ncbi:MAG TPA: hypothetical protein VFB96_20555 [Pirellulaceae bacterium]|nr:hypothetical protein [Pirellulaceae bacterium]